MQTTQIIKKWQKKKIQKIKIKTSLDTGTLNNLLNHIYNFVGVFPQNHLNTIKFLKTPFSLIVNTDCENQSGTHWIAINITNSRIEICDSLGFKPNSWSNYPTHLMLFIHRFLNRRKLVITPQIQSEYSNACGLYCLLFIMFRQKRPFKTFINLFSSHYRLNDQIVYSYFE